MSATPEQSLRMSRARSAARKKLLALGIDTDSSDRLSVLSKLCETHMDAPRRPREAITDHLLRVCRASRAAPAASGEVVQPFVVNLMERDQIEASRLPTGNPRMDDMDSLPHQVSMPWDGKGAYWRQHGDTEHFGKGERR